ncbi:MAG: universal stress protein UspA, partial [Rhodospirillales bacterium]|nr:universal stress protein UspA [Rhodospirillales bacterium]
GQRIHGREVGDGADRVGLDHAEFIAAERPNALTDVNSRSANGPFKFWRIGACVAALVRALAFDGLVWKSIAYRCGALDHCRGSAGLNGVIRHAISPIGEPMPWRVPKRAQKGRFQAQRPQPQRRPSAALLIDRRQGRTPPNLLILSPDGFPQDRAGAEAWKVRRMLRDLIVALDGSPEDDPCIATVEDLSVLFGAHVTALFLNYLPDPIVPADAPDLALDLQLKVTEQAREAGDILEATIARKLASLPTAVDIRRFDILRAAKEDTIVSEARTADVFVSLRPGLGRHDDDRKIVEGVLFGSGRHLFLSTGKTTVEHRFAHALVAWNGSREAARAMAEAIPYLLKSRAVTVAIKADDPAAPEVISAENAVTHLRRHGVEAALLRLGKGSGSVSVRLIETAGELQADLIVAGGYSHWRLAERLLGGVTHDLLRHAHVSLVIAH